MSLIDLIRGKNAPDKFATATLATFATPKPEETRTVATVATVAVAIPGDPITETLVKGGASDPATTSCWWLIRYPDSDPAEMACCPEATHAEILEWYPDAIAAEPFEPTIRQPSAPMSANDEQAIRAWLAMIEETDPATIAEVFSQCQRDADARDYFTGRAAAELPKPDSLPQ